ncbi:hypothetical protein [Acidisarcina polymorpha]|uniref:hypothetical protein n=1 Tax=Acidisarcina polymorpha TaxID=2211140 RepID=UPI001374983D|nr:hypothetical protein [Acidisarcina polymorpha]
MRIDPEIGSRHLLGTDGLAEQPNAVQQFIRIILSEDWAHSAAGQIIAECLVNLLVRQVGLVEQLEVVAASDVPLLIRPILKGDWQTLSDYLAAVGEWAVGMEVHVGPDPSPRAADQTIVIGSVATLNSKKAIACVADGWRAWCGELQHVPHTGPSRSRNPIGPLFAAALVARDLQENLGSSPRTPPRQPRILSLDKFHEFGVGRVGRRAIIGRPPLTAICSRRCWRSR